MRFSLFLLFVFALFSYSGNTFAADYGVVGSGDTIDYDYTLKVDGKVVETTDDTIADANNISSKYYAYISSLGNNEEPEGLEQAMIGMKIGEEKTIIVPPEKGFLMKDYEKTARTTYLSNHGTYTVSGSDLSPVYSYSYSLSDDFDTVMQKRIKVGTKVKPLYASRFGTVKSIDGDNVEIEFVDKKSPFYFRKPFVGMVVFYEGTKYTITKMENNNVTFQVDSKNAPFGDTPLAVGLEGEYYGQNIRITRIEGDMVYYIPTDSYVGKTLEYTVKIREISRKIDSGTYTTTIRTTLNSSDEE